MAGALTPPVLVAALVVMLAGLAKLRAPTPAAQALSTLGLPRSPAAVRTLAAVEIGLGGAVILAGGSVLLAALAGLYTAFALVAHALVVRQANCGCFGGAGTPASWLHVGLNALFALACAGGALADVHGVDRLFAQPSAQVPVAVVALIAAAAAAILVYVEAPRAWQAWSGG